MSMQGFKKFFEENTDADATIGWKKVPKSLGIFTRHDDINRFLSMTPEEQKQHMNSLSTADQINLIWQANKLGKTINYRWA